MRNMPVDLVLVRHGQSEGNLAQKLAKQGLLQNTWTAEFRDRHNSLYRLTDTGRMQAAISGAWIKQNISPTFDKYFTSEYVRAMETAAALELPNARWGTEIYLRERDRGILAGKPQSEREAEHKEEMLRKEKDSFYWQPSGGESIANLCLRVDRVLENLAENASGLRVIIVCHGGVIKSFRALIERTRSTEYTRQNDRIHNCQIVWYSRRDARTGYISSKFSFVRSVCPWDLKLSHGEWRRIRRNVYSNDELLQSVSQVSQLVNQALEQSGLHLSPPSLLPTPLGLPLEPVESSASRLSSTRNATDALDLEASSDDSDVDCSLDPLPPLHRQQQHTTTGPPLPTHKSFIANEISPVDSDAATDTFSAADDVGTSSQIFPFVLDNGVDPRQKSNGRRKEELSPRIAKVAARMTTVGTSKTAHHHLPPLPGANCFFGLTADDDSEGSSGEEWGMPIVKQKTSDDVSAKFPPIAKAGRARVASHTRSTPSCRPAVPTKLPSVKREPDENPAPPVQQEPVQPTPSFPFPWDTRASHPPGCLCLMCCQDPYYRPVYTPPAPYYYYPPIPPPWMMSAPVEMYRKQMSSEYLDMRPNIPPLPVPYSDRSRVVTSQPEDAKGPSVVKKTNTLDMKIVQEVIRDVKVTSKRTTPILDKLSDPAVVVEATPEANPLASPLLRSARASVEVRGLNPSESANEGTDCDSDQEDNDNDELDEEAAQDVDMLFEASAGCQEIGSPGLHKQMSSKDLAAMDAYMRRRRRRRRCQTEELAFQGGEQTPRRSDGDITCTDRSA